MRRPGGLLNGFNKKLHANTLLEAVVAMVIIAMVFATAMTIFEQVMNHPDAGKKVKAYNVLQRYAVTTNDNAEYYNSNISISPYVLKRDVSEYRDKVGVILVHYSIFDSTGNLIEEKRELRVSKISKLYQ